MEVRRLAVVGTGLIGASVALAAKRAGLREVLGYDPDPKALDAAVERGAIDSGAESLADAVAGTQLAVVAAPGAPPRPPGRAGPQAREEDCTGAAAGGPQGGGGRGPPG